MSLFLTLLATFLFFEIIKRDTSQYHSNKNTLYFWYSVSATACLSSHYLTFPVFVAHGFIFLFTAKEITVWKKMIFALVLPIISLSYWLVAGGGKYSLKTMQDVGAFYKNIALHPPNPNPYIGLIDKVSINAVLYKLLPVLADLFLLTNSLTTSLIGSKNLIIAVCVSVFICFCFYRFLKSNLNIYLSFILGISCLQYFVYSANPLSFIQLSLVGVLVFLYFRYHKFQKVDYYLALMIVVSIVLMMLQVVLAGHTFSINQRYLAFVFPFSIILIAKIIWFNWRFSKYTKFIVLALLPLFLKNIYIVNQDIYDDQNPKYTYFAQKRETNPHAKAAQLAQKNYQTGDTLILPNINRGTFADVGYTQASKSVFDSQLINLYLCETSLIIQKVNIINSTLLILKKKEAKSDTLFDFKGLIY